jgi:hypothetical protein
VATSCGPEVDTPEPGNASDATAGSTIALSARVRSRIERRARRSWVRVARCVVVRFVVRFVAVVVRTADFRTTGVPVVTPRATVEPAAEMRTAGLGAAAVRAAGFRAGLRAAGVRAGAAVRVAVPPAAAP